VHEGLLHISRIKAVMSFLDKRVVADLNFLMSTKPYAAK
jgi:hypothetical protein